MDINCIFVYMKVVVVFTLIMSIFHSLVNFWLHDLSAGIGWFIAVIYIFAYLDKSRS